MNKKTILLFFLIFLFSMFLIFRKNYINEINSDLNKMIVEIQNLTEIRNNLLLEKWEYLDLSNIEQISKKDLNLVKINEKDFIVLKKDFV